MNLKKHIATHVREIPKSGIREFFDIVAQEKRLATVVKRNANLTIGNNAAACTNTSSSRRDN